MKRIWIVGAEGHVGRALSEILNCTEYEIFETDKKEVDITDLSQVEKFVGISRPDVVINCAGINEFSEDKNISDDEYYRVNAVGARNLAQSAQAIQAKMIHLSTDDVFGNTEPGPYNEFDEVHPSGIYGKSKYAGEKFVSQLMTRYVIIRSSWIYGIGRDFVDMVLKAAYDSNTDVLSVYKEDYAVPTSAKELAKIIAVFIEHDDYGVYHAVCTGGFCSRKEFALEILKCAGLQDQLEIVESDGQNENAGYSVLDNMMLRITGMEEPADWRKTLADYIRTTGATD